MSTFFQQFRNTVKHWYVPLLIGILLIVLGLYMFSVPVETYFSLVTLFSIWFFILGVMEVFFALQNQSNLEGWGWYLVGAIIDLVIGCILIYSPVIASQTLPIFVGFSILFRAFQGIGFALDMKKFKNSNWLFLLLSSIVSVVFAFLILVNPIFAGFSIVIMTGMAFVFSGISAVVLSFQLRKFKDNPKISEEWKARIKALEDEYNEELKNK